MDDPLDLAKATIKENSEGPRKPKSARSSRNKSFSHSNLRSPDGKKSKRRKSKQEEKLKSSDPPSESEEKLRTKSTTVPDVKIFPPPIIGMTPQDLTSLADVNQDQPIWSDYEKQFTKAQQEIIPDELKVLFDLSSYDVSVKEQERVSARKEHLFKLLENEEINSFARSCLLSFVSNWKIVKGSFYDCGVNQSGSEGNNRSGFTVTLSEGQYSPKGLHNVVQQSSSSNLLQQSSFDDSPNGTEAVDVEMALQESLEEAVDNVKHSIKTNLPPHIFKSMQEKIDGVSAHQRPAVHTESATTFRESNLDYVPNTRIKQLVVTGAELKFGEVAQPYYCALSLHDIQTKKKITEDFTFELNSEEFKTMWFDEVNPITSMTSCSISLLNSHNRLTTFMIVSIYKHLSSEIEQKTKKNKKDSNEFSIANAKKMGFILQPYAWTAVNMYFDKNLNSDTLVLDDFKSARAISYLDMYDQINRSLSDGKKGKEINGSLMLHITQTDALPSGLLDPSFSGTHPSTVSTQEIQSFSPKEHPAYSLVNNLYVYPLSISVKHSNVQICVELRADDADPKQPGLPVVYGKYGGATFTTSGSTSITPKDKRPTFCDEIKMKLPVCLTSSFHLLFTAKNQSGEIIGQAFCPIYSPSYGVLKNERRSVVLIPAVSPNYFSSQAPNSDSRRFTLTFETRVISSIYSDSAPLVNLSKILDNKEYQGAEFVLQSLHTLNPSLAISHFPPVFCALKQLACRKDKKISKEAIHAFLSIIGCIQHHFPGKGTACNSHLLFYVRYLQDSDPSERVPFHENLCKYWLEMLKEGEDKERDEIWILLNFMLKSMIMHLCSFPLTPDARLKAFPSKFTTNLKELALRLFCDSRDIQNMETLTLVPLFMKDLLGLIDRGVVFEMIHVYIAWLNQGANQNSDNDLFLATVKYTFIKRITEYKYYIPLNLPHPAKLPNQKPSLREHFFAGLIATELRAGLVLKQRVREQSIGTLRQLLQSHDTDPRYFHPIVKQRIAGLYFDFVSIALGFQYLLSDFLRLEERVNWLLCFFYILENSDRDLVLQWWATSPQDHLNFLCMMEIGLDVFKNQQFFKTMSFVILDLLLDFVLFLHRNPDSRNNVSIGKIFDVIQQLQMNQPPEFTEAYYSLLVAATNVFADEIFRSKNSSYCASLSYQVLRHCKHNSALSRRKACSTFYFLLKRNYEETGDVLRIKHQSTISLCKLLAESNKNDTMFLQNSLTAIRNFSEENAEKELKPLICGTIASIQELLHFNEQLAENDENPEVKAELLIKIADSYTNSLNLRMTWLEALASHHASHNHQAEACLVHAQIACIIAQHLDGESPIWSDSFKRIYPKCDFDMISHEVEFPEEEFTNCNITSLIEQLEKSVEHAKAVLLYETAIDLYTMLAQCYRKTKNYNMLMHSLNECNQTTVGLIKAEHKNTRLFYSYFRVTFYGDMFGDEDGVEYIYRFSKKENLMTIQRYLKDVIMKAHHIEDENQIEVLGNAAVDRSSLESNKAHLQLAVILPFFATPDEDVVGYEHHFNLQTFLFESSFGKGEQTSKKKTIFYTATSFPSITTRLRVSKTEETRFTPLQSAIELIREHANKFEAELNTSNDIKGVNRLQQLLQGSVFPMVNEGPLKICNTFLAASERGAFPQEDIAGLEAELRRFIKFCGFAVAFTNQIIESRGLDEFKQFQKIIEGRYKAVKEEMLQYLTSQDK